MNGRMPRDRNNHPIPALRPAGKHKPATVDGTAVLTELTPGVEVISVLCRNATLRYQTGDAEVVADANSHCIEIGERLVISLGSADAGDLHTHISIIREGAANGILEISELE